MRDNAGVRAARLHQRQNNRLHVGASHYPPVSRSSAASSAGRNVVEQWLWRFGECLRAEGHFLRPLCSFSLRSDRFRRDRFLSETQSFPKDPTVMFLTVTQSDSTGKLGFHEFKYLWNNIKKWQAVYKTFDSDHSGLISADELPRAFTAAGFPLNDQLFQMIIRRYSDENGNMDFDNYIGCLVRLDAMCRAFKTLDKDNNGTIKVNIKEWLQLTMYS